MSLPTDEDEAKQIGLVLTLAKGAGISLIGRVAGRGLLLVGQAILARSLGRSDYGLFTLGWTILQISLYATPIGLPQGVIRFGALVSNSDTNSFRRVIQQTLAMALATAVVSGGILFLLSPLIATIFSKSDLVFIFQATAIALGLSVLLKVFAAATRISRRMQFSMLVEDVLPAALLAVGALVFTVMQDHGLYGSEVSLLLSYAVSVVLALGFLLWLYPGVFRPVTWQRSLFRDLAAFSVPASLVGTLTVLIQWSTRLILGYFQPEEAVGVYQVASQLASLPAIVLSAMGAIFTPLIPRLFGEGKIKQLDNLYKITTKWILYVSLPFFLVLVFLPSASISVVFGTSYADSKWPLIIMAVGQLINTATGTVVTLHVMLGYQKRLIGILIVALAITVLLNVWWIPAWGVMGAAAGNMIGISISNVAGLFSLRQVTGLWPYDRRYWKGIVAALVTVVPVALIAAFLHAPDLVTLLVAGVAAVALFAFLVWRMGLDNEDMQFLSAVRKRLGV